MIERLGIDEGQIAREHEPRSRGMGGLRRRDAGDRAEVRMLIDDTLEATAHRIGQLIRTYRHECALDARLE
jgi:hypothetical protein